MIIEVPFSDVKDIIQAAFPGESSRRTVKVQVRQTYQVSDYWSEGSRNHAAFVKLDGMQVIQATNLPAEARQQAGNPYHLAAGEVMMTPGIVVVEHTIFCGKDLGFRLYVHADNMSKMLPAKVPNMLTERDKRILVIHRGIKSGPYRQEALREIKATSTDLDGLVALGYLNRNKAGSISLTQEGRMVVANERI